MSATLTEQVAKLKEAKPGEKITIILPDGYIANDTGWEQFLTDLDLALYSKCKIEIEPFLVIERSVTTTKR